ncbi:MAG: beta-lactamase family protein [Nitrospirota bacterium]|nr:beta-lactamase family protein [Nitrospirota bacterium]
MAGGKTDSGPERFAATRRVLAAGVAEGVFPGAVLWVAERGAVVWRQAAGSLFRADAGHPPAPAVHPGTRYDLASITKAMSTASCFMRLMDQGRLDPADPVSRLLPELAWATADVTLFHLLTHSSGLPAWKPFYEMACGADGAGLAPGTPACRDWIVRRIMAEPPERPAGEKSVYSDPGFILLGVALERATGTPLEELFRRLVAEPLGLADTAYNPGNQARRLEGHDVAPTARRDWRGGVIRGAVDDDNAFAMGGVSGHAGLFGTAGDVGRWGLALVDAWHGRSTWTTQAVARRCLTRNTVVPGSSWALGFDTPYPPPTTAGPHFGRTSAGHLGFTGTSVWVDLEREWVVVLLSNRVHPDPENSGIKRFRPRLHAAVGAALLGLPPVPEE